MHPRTRLSSTRDVPELIDPATLPPTLPTARAQPSLPTSRLWSLLFLLLQSLSVLPSLLGFAYSCRRFSSDPPLLYATSTWITDGTGITQGRSTKLDWCIAGLWSLACAYFSHSLAKGLLRRWLVYYSLLPTVIRVITLQAICWPLTLTTHRVLSFDQPVAAWLVCATTAAFSNVIQIWVTSNIATVERKDRRTNASMRWLSAIVAAVVGPGVRTEKFRKNDRAVSWKKVLWGTILPFALLGWITTTALLWQQFTARYQGGGGVSLSSGMPGNYGRAEGGKLSDLNHDADVRVIMLVTSSWTNRSLSNRHNFRQSTALLIPSSPSISIAYQFLLGTAPSPQAQAKSGHLIEAEALEYGDLVMVPAHDGYNQLSKKIYQGWKWASHLDVDYVLKTDDDMFLRMDVISKELIELGRRREYWRGFAYWAIPAISDASNKNADFSYELSSFPPYTAGALHILSHDLVTLITPPSSSRLFVMNEDQNLGLWLYPSGVRPLHDHRIQQGQICENDMIAKHFGGQYKEPNELGPREMYANVVAGRPLCSGGYVSTWCGVCYPGCRGKENHWRDWGFACDPIKGATLAKRASGSGSSSAVTIDAPVKAIPEPFVMGSVEDPWVIPGLLSRHSSPFSQSDDWHLLHMLCWTTGAETFQERHYQAMETIWAHEPRAILFMMSTSLPLDFFQMYTDHGYAIHVVRIGAKELLERGWHLGPESERWLGEWDRWSQGPNFFSHLTDYLRYLFLFKFGGTYLDMDAPWVRSPPNSHLEFIGADYSTVASDLDWTLDDEGMYLAPGVMRFKKGWNLFREIMESAFSLQYSAACFNCVGPKAITIHAKAARRALELNGFTILPNTVLYPKNWQTSHELVVALSDDEGKRALKKMIEGSWSIHLFGKMTNHLRIEEASIVGQAFEAFSLKIPRRAGYLSSSAEDRTLGTPKGLGAGLELRGPIEYRYRTRAQLALDEVKNLDLVGSLDGRFEGLDIIFIRAAKAPRVERAKIVIKIGAGGTGRVTWSSSSARLLGSSSSGEGELGGGKEISISLEKDVTVREVNTILGSIVYLPGRPGGVYDLLQVEVRFGEERVEGRFKISL